MSKETILDILKEMRTPLPEFELGNKDVERLLRFYANRIEDAAGRLVEEIKSAVNAQCEESFWHERIKTINTMSELESNVFATKGETK